MIERLSVAVVIASLGRPNLIEDMINNMEHQSVRPSMLLFSTVSADDLPADFVEKERVKSIFAPKGLTFQRNAALDYLGDSVDVILFYDDDFVPSQFSIENVARFFAAFPDVVGATGHVLADGIQTSGIGAAEAKAIVAAHDERRSFPLEILSELPGLYGCNMAYRSSAIQDLRFDERLRLYAWQEDFDFANALTSRGKIVKTPAFAGVHMGAKMGRETGVRLGYSQVINPIYLVSKGTMPIDFALMLMGRNILANHAKVFRSEPWVDRRGRVKGNWIGLLDVFRGRLTPERIEDL